MNEELREIENRLEQLSPVVMPDDMFSRMEQAMEKWHEHVPVEEKIVPFGGVQQRKWSLKGFNTWASAAAIALMAAASYVVFYGGGEAQPIVASTQPLAQVTPAQNITNVVPASNTEFDSEVTGVSKEMITYDAKGRAMRVMQIEFQDEVTVRGSDGKVYKVSQPRMEYYAVPVEVH